MTQYAPGFYDEDYPLEQVIEMVKKYRPMLWQAHDEDNNFLGLAGLIVRYSKEYIAPSEGEFVLLLNHENKGKL